MKLIDLHIELENQFPKTINNKTVAMVYVDLLGCSYHKINFKGGGSMTFSDVTEYDFWKNRSLTELNW